MTAGVAVPEEHKGEIEHFVSALLGCNLSGDRALLNKGDPGSEPLGLAKLFLDCAVTVMGADPALGLYDCVVLELPVSQQKVDTVI